MNLTKEELYNGANMENFEVVDMKENMPVAYYTMFLMAHNDKLHVLPTEMRSPYGDTYTGDTNLYMDIFNSGVEVWSEERSNKPNEQFLSLADVVGEKTFYENAIRRFEEKNEEIALEIDKDFVEMLIDDIEMAKDKLEDSLHYLETLI